jgi:polyketide cyclase/dehydrase/lipid transport protein
MHGTHPRGRRRSIRGVRLEVHEVIDRSPSDVFRFVATEHVRNHPRWDPVMQLEQVTDGPIGVGTTIRRRHTHYGHPVEGTMEVVEFEPDRAFGMVIHDGPVEIRSRLSFDPEGQESTRLTGIIEIPSATSPIDPAPIEASLREMKRLIESET